MKRIHVRDIDEEERARKDAEEKRIKRFNRNLTVVGVVFMIIFLSPVWMALLWGGTGTFIGFAIWLLLLVLYVILRILGFIYDVGMHISGRDRY